MSIYIEEWHKYNVIVRILYLTNVAMNENNGAVIHIKHFISAMETHGHSVRRVSYRGKKSLWGNILFSLHVILSEIQLINDYDIIYLRYYPLAFFETVIARVLNKPLFIEYNAVVEEEMKLTKPHMEFIVPYVKLCSRIASLFADGLIALSEGIGFYLNSQYNKSKERILISSNASIRQYQKDHAIMRKGIIAFSNKPWYSVYEILKLRDKLMLEDIELDVYISGYKGKETEHIQINRQIDYSKYDFGLIMINREYARDKWRFGIRPVKFYEYLSGGLAVIVPDIHDINTITENNHIGTVYKDNKSIIRSISKLYENNAAEMKILKGNAQYYVDNICSWDIVAGALTDFMRMQI